jgi:hypothetical protein
MSIKDKLMFWKKDDPFDFDNFSPNQSANPDPLGTNASQTPLQENLGLPSDNVQDTFAPSSQGGPQNYPGEAPAYNMDAQKPSAFANAATAKNDSQTQREMELLNSKLDTIKALLASLDQRMGVIEQIARAEQAKQQKENRPGNHLW